MDNKIVITIVIVALVLVGGYFLLRPPLPPSVAQNTTQQTVTTTPESTTTQVAAFKTYDVVYTDSGYSPATLTIKAGDTVNFKNESTAGDWVGSAMHPSHMVYSGTTLQQHCSDTANTAFDECKADKPGESWSFTFTKVGSWGYHNHVDARHFGKIVVE